MISPSVIHSLSHRSKLVRARAAGQLALVALRLPAPAWLENLATNNADRWLSELGL
jgi:hypothetical protein